MASQSYFAWLQAGRPYALCRPGAELRNVFTAAGFTVYHYPDEAHLTADPPQDHTPFSATGWPVPSARGIGHAIDIMPMPGLMPLPDLARRLIADRDAGVPGTWAFKYINWTDEWGDCRHVAWQPDKTVTTSIDRGHIHLSLRSDADDWAGIGVNHYNPFRSEAAMTLSQTDVNLIMTSDTVPNDPAKNYSLGGAVYDTAQRVIAIRDDVKTLLSEVTLPPAGPPPITVDQLAQSLIAALTAHPDVVDALVTAVAARIGMIPTAIEIARATGELIWHGTPPTSAV